MCDVTAFLGPRGVRTSGACARDPYIDWGVYPLSCRADCRLQLILESFFKNLEGDTKITALQTCRPQSPNPAPLWYSTDKLPSTEEKKWIFSGDVRWRHGRCLFPGLPQRRARRDADALPLGSGLGPRDSNSAPTATVQGYDGQCAVSPRHHHLTDGTAATRFDRLWRRRLSVQYRPRDFVCKITPGYDMGSILYPWVYIGNSTDKFF